MIRLALQRALRWRNQTVATVLRCAMNDQIRHPESGRWVRGGTGPEFEPTKSAADATRLMSGDTCPNPIYNPSVAGKFVDMRTYLPGSSAGMKQLADDARVEAVPLADLLSPQKTAVVGKLRSMAERADADGSLDLSGVRVVKFRNDYFLEDGNHRLGALKLLGVRKVRVPVEDLDAYLAAGGARSPLKLENKSC